MAIQTPTVAGAILPSDIPDLSQAPDLAQIPDLSVVIDALGRPEFEGAFMSFLHDVSGAEHCTMFRVGQDSFTVVAAASLDGEEVGYRQAGLYAAREYWRRDPAMRESRRRLERSGQSLLRIRIDDIRDPDLRDTIYMHHPVAERVLICGRCADADFGLSVLRNARSGQFADGDVLRLAHWTRTLLALLQKHAALDDRRRRPLHALSSIATIESCLEATLPALSPRERQVCARILFGQTTAWIAADLRIGRESVATYRKRAYARLGVGTRQELTRLYLRSCAALPAD